MGPRPYILAETEYRTVTDTDYQVAVLPWGATEAHNYHLPYATDNIQCDYIAAEAARRAWERGTRVIVLPTVPFGVNTGQFDIKLDINMNPSTQQLVLRDVVESLSYQGIPRLVVLNGHGGNDFKQMIREIQPRFPKVFLSALNWYKVLDNGAFFDEPGDHAGEMETSNVMHITPHLVRPLGEAGPGTARPFRVRALREGTAWAPRQWSSATEDTGVGNPAKSDPEKGRRFLEALADELADFLVDLASVNVRDMYQ
jgi:creatinine amidohydrolase